MTKDAELWERIKRVSPKAGISPGSYRVAKCRGYVPKAWRADLIELSRGTSDEIQYHELNQ